MFGPLAQCECSHSCCWSALRIDMLLRNRLKTANLHRRDAGDASISSRNVSCFNLVLAAVDELSLNAPSVIPRAQRHASFTPLRYDSCILTSHTVCACAPSGVPCTSNALGCNRFHSAGALSSHRSVSRFRTALRDDV